VSHERLDAGQKTLSPDKAVAEPQRLQIVHCCGRFTVNQGGAERQARAVCEALAARGHRVTVIARRTGETGRVVPSVTVHATIRAVDRGRLFGVTYLGSAISRLVLAARGCDILHAHHLYLDAAAALLAGRICRRPVVAKVTGAGPGGDLDRLRKTAGGGGWLRLFGRLDAVIAPSATCREELLRAGFPADRIRLIPNGVDVDRFRPQSPEGLTDTSIPWSGPAVVFAGRLVEGKGLLELLEAWPRVVREVPQAHLVILGSGPLETVIRARAAVASVGGRVHLMGEVSDVRPYLRTAAAFVFPSRAEGLPNAMLEAMAMGLPCVATRIGPIVEMATDGKEALLVPVQNPEQLASALSAVLQQPELGSRLGHAARKRVEAEFSLERQVDAVETLYFRLTHGRR
jgi:L-malate glycosyltransferase